jgi:dTMP kinase
MIPPLKTLDVGEYLEFSRYFGESLSPCARTPGRNIHFFSFVNQIRAPSPLFGLPDRFLIIEAFFYRLCAQKKAGQLKACRLRRRCGDWEKGLFITFEGIEGCGKTTQIKRLSKRLRAHAIPFITTLEPGGTEMGKGIRRILLDSRNKNLTPLAELVLYAADRAQHVEEVIKPALEQGKWVICDRFADATVVYQGSARGQDMGLVRLLNETVTQGIWPDLTFVLDCPVEKGLERALSRNQTRLDESLDRFENEDMAFHRAVRQAYLDLAWKERKRFVIIDASAGEGEVAEEIFKHITPHLNRP